MTISGLTPVSPQPPTLTPNPFPSVPPTPPVTPPMGVGNGAGASSLLVDLTEASRLAARATEMLAEVSPFDTGSEATKDLRVRIFRTNMAVQTRLERQFEAGHPAALVADLRRADAFLEDANWQLARTPSPDGRFTGVDIPGAVRDTAEGVRIIDQLLRAAGGTPSQPRPPAFPPPSTDPVAPPTAPPAPPSTPPSTPAPPTGPLPPTSPLPPTAPPSVPPVTVPPTAPDTDYPGEDEFPTDDKILSGSGTGSSTGDA